jgi:hypothetical protein
MPRCADLQSYKIMVVDGPRLTVGHEVSNVNVLDRGVAPELHRSFRHELEGCPRLTLQRWSNRGPLARAQEFVASFLQEQA